jgi:hypothetical protein
VTGYVAVNLKNNRDIESVRTPLLVYAAALLNLVLSFFDEINRINRMHTARHNRLQVHTILGLI